MRYMQQLVIQDKDSCSSNSRKTRSLSSVDSTSNSRSNADLPTWDGDVGIGEDALLHILEVGNSSLDLVDNVLQALLLRGVGRDPRSEHRDRRRQRFLCLHPLT